MSKIVQCELREFNYEKEPETRRIMVTWLEADKNIVVGDTITLKGISDTWWQVMSVGKPHERSDIKRGWGMTDYFGKEADRNVK